MKVSLYGRENPALSRRDHLYIEYKRGLKGRWSCDRHGKVATLYNTIQIQKYKKTKIHKKYIHTCTKMYVRTVKSVLAELEPGIIKVSSQYKYKIQIYKYTSTQIHKYTNT